MSSDDRRLTVRTSGQPEIEAILDDVDGDLSEFVRDAIRMAGREKHGRYPDLTDKEAEAYQWLLDNFAGQRVVRERLLPSLAEHLSLKKDLVDHQILRKLDRKDYLNYRGGHTHSIVKVRLPQEAGNDE